MNKLLKGAVAGAAGVALLLGGAGTFALWSDSASLNVGSIASGTLSIASVGTPAWTNESVDIDDANRTIDDIAAYRVVPGDRLVLEQSVTVNATGDNLVALLSVDDSKITGSLKEHLSPIAVSAFGTGVTPGTEANTFNVAPSAAGTTLSVQVVVELPASVGGDTAQSSTLDLSALALSLEQVR